MRPSTRTVGANGIPASAARRQPVSVPTDEYSVPEALKDGLAEFPQPTCGLGKQRDLGRRGLQMGSVVRSPPGFTGRQATPR